MRFSSVLVRGLLLVVAFALLPLALPATSSAQVTTISTSFQRCKTNVDSYSVQLQSGNQRANPADFPASVTVHFADGTTAEAVSFFGPSFGTATYHLDDSTSVYREVPLLYATAQFDATKYPNHRFTVTAYPCDPTPFSTVSGTITQHGNQKPVSGLEVCLAELGLCTYTDANGYFEFADVDYGTYTLTSDGPVYKPLVTSVEVSWADVYLDLVQYRGGGR